VGIDRSPRHCEGRNVTAILFPAISLLARKSALTGRTPVARMVRDLQAFKTIKKPRQDRSGPAGAGLRSFVFEAKEPGKYKIEVTPVFEGKKRKTQTFEVVVK
jgi:hypothetical protein